MRTIDRVIFRLWHDCQLTYAVQSIPGVMLKKLKNKQVGDLSYPCRPTIRASGLIDKAMSAVATKAIKVIAVNKTGREKDS